MSKKKLFLFILIIIMTLLSACLSIKKIPRDFYLLEYLPAKENMELVQQVPVDQTVLIRDALIKAPYSSKNLVKRNSGPSFSYYENSLWGIDLSENLADLLSRQLQVYQIFSRSLRSSTAFSSPDYEITIQLRKLEQLSENAQTYNSFILEFNLIDREKGEILVKHNSEEKINLKSNSLDEFVLSFNQHYLSQGNEFIRKILIFLEAGN